MRIRKQYRSGLFLIELMIAIAFFAMTTAVFLQAFAKSNAISREAENLFQAQKLCSSVAEILGGADQDAKEQAVATGQNTGDADESNQYDSGQFFLQELQQYFPELETAGSGASIYYDGNWKICRAEDGVYVISAAWQQDGEMWNVTVGAGEVNVSQTAAGQSSIYQLTLRLYRPEAEGGVS